MFQKQNQWVGIVQILLSGICFGFMGLVARYAYDFQFEIGELLFYRFLIAASILGAVLLIFRSRSLRVNRRELFVCMALGILGYAVFATLYFTAIKGVSVPLAALLLYTFPVMVLLGAHFFLHERITSTQMWALPLAVIGLLCLLWGEIQVQSWSAVVAGLLSAVMYSIYILFSRRYQRNISSLTSGFYVMLFAGLALYCVNQPDLSRIPQIRFEEWSVLFVIGVVCTILPMVLFLAGLQKLPSSQAAFLSSAEPLTAAIVAYLFLGESLSLLQIAGGICVIGSMILSSWSRPAG